MHGKEARPQGGQENSVITSSKKSAKSISADCVMTTSRYSLLFADGVNLRWSKSLMRCSSYESWEASTSGSAAGSLFTSEIASFHPPPRDLKSVTSDTSRFVSLSAS